MNKSSLRAVFFSRLVIDPNGDWKLEAGFVSVDVFLTDQSDFHNWQRGKKKTNERRFRPWLPSASLAAPYTLTALEPSVHLI